MSISILPEYLIIFDRFFFKTSFFVLFWCFDWFWPSWPDWNTNHSYQKTPIELNFVLDIIFWKTFYNSSTWKTEIISNKYSFIEFQDFRNSFIDFVHEILSLILESWNLIYCKYLVTLFWKSDQNKISKASILEKKKKKSEGKISS